jgi:hypothetical protein
MVRIEMEGWGGTGRVGRKRGRERERERQDRKCSLASVSSKISTQIELDW